ncbi:max dimerization protein 1-like isoform X1 [Limulus polyphemus]|uniref:Max dimerization protein 1-like isoform X1 n=1 Tax=Limulus polyphemus TaxID=6850 RepID=A0ABM1B4C0_LIMPO|nr:max dimerization protein 1-like isoform X1 [Limulus polyphemus]
MSIAALIQAAEYLDRREREAEHGYASTLSLSRDLRHRRAVSKKSHSQGHFNRTTHNELEKNRRAHLRDCMENLKEMVPLDPDSSRHTTLGLLTKAKLFIKGLEEREKKQQVQKEQLLREQRYLRRRRDHLGAAIVNLKRGGTNASTSVSESSPSQSDDIDILGYNSNPSDTDDHNSVQSMNSDGGMAITTRRLPLVNEVTL